LALRLQSELDEKTAWARELQKEVEEGREAAAHAAELVSRPATGIREYFRHPVRLLFLFALRAFKRLRIRFPSRV
jgi:hypothetical protein